jgi:hypothetical protein
MIINNSLAGQQDVHTRKLFHKNALVALPELEVIA